MNILFKRLDSAAVLPKRAHPEDAGLDLTSIADYEIKPQHSVMVSTGVAAAIPVGSVGLLLDRSSMAKRGIKTAGGVIDAGYRGEIKVILWNISHEVQKIQVGERVTQLVIFPISLAPAHEVTDLDDTARGEKGFGSSGK